MSRDVFGVWNKVGPVYHHFVGGRPLCRRPVEPSGVGPPTRRCQVLSIAAQMCPECREANAARWSGAYGPETGVPLDERSGVT